MTDAPNITYYHMGQWPLYFGFTMCPEAFAKEVARLGCPDIPFLASDHANAAMHSLTYNGSLTCIIALEKPKGRSKEQVAGMIAHEAMHVIQELWAYVGEEKPGREAEAYLMQQIVQCCLQDAWATGRTRKAEP